MDIHLVGNDIELDNEKVARLFDINATTRDRLKETIERANKPDTKSKELLDIIEVKIQEAYEEGKSNALARSLIVKGNK
jgi:hypothetical protein